MKSRDTLLETRLASVRPILRDFPHAHIQALPNAEPRELWRSRSWRLRTVLDGTGKVKLHVNRVSDEIYSLTSSTEGTCPWQPAAHA